MATPKIIRNVTPAPEREEETPKVLVPQRHTPPQPLTSKDFAPKRVFERRREKGGKKVAQKKGKQHQKHSTHTVYSLDRIISDETVAELTWTFEGAMTNVGLAYASVRYAMSGLYDPDPILGGNSFLGLAQWATFYNYYRPLSTEYSLEVANREAFPMALHLYFTNSDPGIVGNSGASFAMNEFGKSTMLGPLNGGQSIRKFKGMIQFQRMLGGRDIEEDDNFRGLCGSANPTDEFWMGFNTASGVAQTAAGVYFTLRFKTKTRIYDRVAIV